MNPEEHLREVMRELDDTVVVALENMETPGYDGLRLITRPVGIAYRYQKALSEAAKDAPTEIAEHYLELAKVAVPKAEFRMAAIGGYRGKHNISTTSPDETSGSAT